MAFWIPPLWFGEPVESDRRAIALGTPVHTVMIEVLTDGLAPDDIAVWPDASRSDPREDSVVVQNAGGDWTIAATPKQRRTRTLRLVAQSPTSDGAERLIDKVFKIIRAAPEMRVVSVSDFAGGYNEEAEFYYRGFEISCRAKL